MRSIMPFNLKRIMVLLVVFPLLMGTACSLPQVLTTIGQQEQTDSIKPVDEQSNGEESGMDNSREIGTGEDATEVRFMPEGYESPSYPFSQLGSISFTADSESASEVELEPGNTSVKLDVTDQSGLKWTLFIPDGAMESKQTIKMVPLSQINSSGLIETVGEVVSGVQLVPDGLTFLKPVQLSVTGAVPEKVTFILSGSHVGSDVGYTVQDTAASQPTAQILHFSTYYASQPENEEIKEIAQNARDEYKRLTAEAKKILKSPLDIPSPPSIPLECPDAETGQKNYKLISNFVNNALNPEDALIVQLLEQKTILELTGEYELDSSWDLEAALGKRIVRKAIALMDQFSGQQDKLTAVSQFAFTAGKKLALLGDNENLVDEIISRMATWNSELIDLVINDIKKNHNYKKIPIAWMVAHDAELLGAAINTESFLEKLKSALQFEVEYTFEVNMPDINNVTNVVIPVQFDPLNGGLYQCSGEGQGVYLQAEVNDEDITVETFPYPVRVVVKEFDPCNGTVMIGIDRFGSEADTMTFTVEDFSKTSPWPISKNAGESLFDNELDNGMFWFQLPVENGSANAVDQTIERSKFDAVEGSLTIRLIHK